MTWKNPGYGIPDYTSSSSVQYSFGKSVNGTAALDYKLCWSSLNETNTTYYKMKIGTFKLGGPLLQSDGTYSCVMGEDCTIQVIGHLLAASNYLLILDEDYDCGTSTNLASITGESWSNPKQARDVIYYDFYQGRAGMLNMLRLNRKPNKIAEHHKYVYNIII